jgi:hypothetical protein
MKALFFAIIFPSFLWGTTFNTHISFTGEPIVALRSIHNAFNTLGYRLDIQKLRADGTSGELSATAVGNKILNGAVLAENLKEENIRIEKARLDGQDLDLVLDARSAKWNVSVLAPEEGTELKRVSAPQWFQIDQSRYIRISPPYVGKWYPDITVLNEQMGVVYSYRSSEPKEEVVFELPQGAFYLMVSNTQGMKMIKEGMWIESLNGR